MALSNHNGGLAVAKNQADNWDNIVTVDWLAERLGRDDVVIADCRFNLADPAAGRQAYAAGHIPGAVYFDLDRDLSRPARGDGGRHPLPPVAEVVTLFGRAGIGGGVKVVCYDAQKGMIAARLWWMLRYLGHQEAALLDGGFDAWRAAGLPISTAPANPVPRTFVPRMQPDMIATRADVRALSADRTNAGAGTLIDARAPERYRGETEPLDPVAGHIPGAVNVPWEAHVDSSGRFRTPAEIAELYAGIGDGAETVVHCGSGVSGCVNIVALERAGRRGAKLYVGGWSDWCSDPANPVATGPEPDGGHPAATRS